MIEIANITSLIKEIRETTQFFLKLPELVSTTFLDAELAFRSRRERIQKLKEIVELRELAKILQNLYHAKSNLLVEAKRARDEKNIEHAKIIKYEISYINEELEDFRDIIKKTSFSNTALATETCMFVARAIKIYELFFTIKDEDLVEDEILVEIANSVVKLSETGTHLIKKLDEHRKYLDHTYG